MATVNAFIRTTKKDTNALCNVRFRLTDGRKIQLFGKSQILVSPNVWDAKNQKIKAKVLYNEHKRAEFDKDITKHKTYIIDEYNKVTDKESLSSEWMDQIFDKFYNPEKFKSQSDKGFFEYLNDFIETRKISEGRKRSLRVVLRTLKRFEKYKKTTFNIHTFDSKLQEEFDSFLFNEYILHSIHPDIYEGMSKKKLPKARSQNTISGIHSKLRAFWNWCNEKEFTDNSPFKKFKIVTPTYGTPIYITKDERNKIYDYDLSKRPQLAIQRDIFVFQCLIGCRVGDLLRLKKSNVCNDVLSYIANKTKEDKPKTIQVPLSDKAKEILSRYKATDDDRLLPFISEQKYNDAIKEVFTLAGVTRTVTWLNPTTRMEEQRPINEIASSHMARRTFVGNLYAQVKDPNIVGAMSGHVEGSRAFARYRDINIDVKKEIVNAFLD